MNFKKIIDEKFNIYLPSACIDAVFTENVVARIKTKEDVIEVFSRTVIGLWPEDVTRTALNEAITSRSWERPAYPMAGNPDGSITAYMCLTDFECELGAASGGNRVHPSIEDLKASRQCVESCGIVEVRVYATKIVKEASDDYETETPN